MLSRRICLGIILLLLWAAGGMAQENTPRRVISLAPHITEMLYKIGAGETLVGRTEYCNFPPAVLSIPSIGGYLNPDYEQIVALQPDLALLFPNPEMSRKLSQLGIATLSIPNETVREILHGIERLGDAFERQERAKAVVVGISDTLETVRRLSAGRISRNALVLIGRERGSLRGLYAAGQKTYLTEILNLCNVSNVFADISLRYFEVSKEDLVVRDPDMIIEFRYGGHQRDAIDSESLRADWQTLSMLKAVRTGEVHIFQELSFLIPGPRVGQTAWRLMNALEPK